MMAKRMVISADSHVVEPDDLWTKAIGHKWGDKVPHIVEEHQGEKGPWLFCGKEYINLAGTLDIGDASAEKMKKANEDPALRLECLDEDSIYAEVLYSTTTMLLMRADSDALVRDGCAVFNDWMIDYCSQAPQRLFGCGQIHMDDPAWACQELDKLIKAGMRAVMINTDMRPYWPRYQDPVYDPFWAKAEEAGIPIMIHIVAGNKRDPFTTFGEERQDIARMLIDLFTDGPVTLANEFIFGGIMDRFPKLTVILGEYELSWYPYWLFRAEQVQDIFIPMIGGEPRKEKVRDYMKRVGQGIIDDPYVSTAKDLVDWDTVMWGSDFPHPRCTYPNSLKVIDEKFGHLGPELIEKITITNAARFYNIDVPQEMLQAAE